MTFIKKAQARGASLALCSSSKNARKILKRIDLNDFFQIIVDGNFVEHQKLLPKPSPEPFVTCMSLLGTSAANTVVFEDAEAGLTSALEAKVKIVVFVNRTNISTARIMEIRNDSLQECTELIVVKSFYELDEYEELLCTV